MKLSPNLQQAVFIERPNRFSALVEVDGARVMAHVAKLRANEGAFRQGRNRVPDAQERPHTQDGLRPVPLVQLEDALVSSDARLPSALVDEAIGNGQLEQFASYTWRRREATFSHSRLDMVLGNGGLCYVEVKSVTLVEDGVGLFPDAPTSRGARHLEALIEAKGQGHRAAVIFVVQREDARAFAPNAPADPLFADTLRKARAAGVEVYAYRCRVSLEEVVDYGPASHTP